MAEQRTYTPAERAAIHAAAKERLARMNEQREQQREQPPPPLTAQELSTTQWGAKRKLDRRSDLEDRLERYVDGDRTALDGLPDDEPLPPKVLNAGERQVLSAYESQRGIIDPETMKKWDAYIDSRVASIVQNAVDMVSDEMGAYVAERE